MYNPCNFTVVIRFQVCIFDILNTAMDFGRKSNQWL